MPKPPRKRRPLHRKSLPPQSRLTSSKSFIGLTGGMGAGKSEALAALEQLGCEVLSTDLVVHELLLTSEVQELVVAALGDVTKDGLLDRELIAERVFGDDEARHALETILWPRVGRRVADFRENAEGIAIVEVPLLFESGMEKAFDATIAVTADEEVRAGRVGDRGHEGREGIQMTQDEKADRADFAVRNDGTLDELREKLSSVIATIGT